MEDKIIFIEDYKHLLKLKEDYENGLITEDDMTLEEMEALHKIYSKEIKDLRETLTKKLLQKSREW